MEWIADIFLAAGALGAGFYCFILSKRLTKFTNLETGVGGAVAVLSAQVDDLTRTLGEAQKSASVSGTKLEDMTKRAEDAAKKLELMMASMHDLPAPDAENSAHSDMPNVAFMRSRGGMV